MVREYPRFLYSNPQKTKSKGPFIIHCLKPMLIIQLTRIKPADPSDFLNVSGAVTGLFVSDGKFIYKLVSDAIGASEDIEEVLHQAAEWFKQQPEYATL